MVSIAPLLYRGGGGKGKKPGKQKRGKAQPAASAVHEVDEVDEKGFAYSVVPLHDLMVSNDEDWCCEGAKEAPQECAVGTPCRP